jgi:Tfp pilus assembly protein PilN
MSQDFYAAFGLGDDDKVITTGDLDGVALASIQGLYAIVQAQEGQIAALQQENTDLQARLAAIEQALGIGQ